MSCFYMNDTNFDLQFTINDLRNWRDGIEGRGRYTMSLRTK